MRKIPLGFGVNRSKVKVTNYLDLHSDSDMITGVDFNIQFLYYMYNDPGWYEIDTYRFRVVWSKVKVKTTKTYILVLKW